MQSGKAPAFPVCVMNAGYSSGWCEESFGIPLTASEILCKAKGDDVCRFIMAPPLKIEQHIREYFKEQPETARKIEEYRIPEFFERVRVQEALRASKEFLQTVVDAITASLVVVDRNHRVVLANRVARRLAGKDPVAASMTCYQVSHRRNAPCDAATNPCPLDQVIAAKAPVMVTHTHFDEAGKPIFAEVTAMPVFDERGEVVQVVESSRDITARVRAEEGLRESEEKFRTISASAQDAIVMMDHQRRVSFWNPAAEKIFGWTSEEAAGKDLHRLLAPEKYRGAYEKGLEQFRRTGEGAAVGKTLELSALRKDGTEFPVEISLAGVKLSDQWHATAILRDITVRKRAEEMLREAKAAAEAAVQAKSQFLANVSHEIRTPMNGIIGMNGLLLDTELTDEQRQYAEAVGNSATALLSIINDILDFSKIEAGKLDLEVLDFDLRAALEDMGDVLAVRPQEKGLEYTCMIDPEVPSLLRGDPGRMRQVLTNLIGNGVKFTAAGEVALHVTLERETDAEARIRFAVTDTGIGIPKDRIDVLFEPFTQGDASTTRKYGGTGLGLSISKQIVDMMGGEIGAESEAGKGSTFWFTVVFGKQAAAPPAPGEYAGNVRGTRILVVDDNATNRLVLKKQLLSWGCRHDEASNGQTALERLRAAVAERAPFRVVILDMQMPGMDGETLGRMIKQDESLRDTLLVMMTSMGKRGDVSRIEKIGFSAYLTKPVKQSQVYDCLATLAGEAMAPETPQARPIITRHTIVEEKRRKMRILLAEDNPTNQIVALRTLEKAGYRADAVANGAEAIAALENVPYDLVLMDVQMPEMDGLDATRRIRDRVSRVQNHEIPIIAMTAHAMKGDRERCIEAGMDDYVSKPVNPKELIEAIERRLGGKGASKAGPAGARAIPQSKVFDRAALLERAEGDEELLKTIVRVFLEDAPRQIAALREALARADAVGLQRQAHCLKSASGSAGATAMQEVAFQIEAAGESGGLEKAAPLVRRIEEEFERLKRVLAEQ
jgi:PAS domain S-box-containing protein